jgi:hypothetical protein
MEKFPMYKAGTALAASATVVIASGAGFKFA